MHLFSSRRLRDAVFHSYTTFRSHWTTRYLSADAASNGSYEDNPTDESSCTVEIELPSGVVWNGHGNLADTDSVASTTSSSNLVIVPTVKFAHVLSLHPVTVHPCRRIRDPPPVLDDVEPESILAAVNPFTGFHALAPPPCHYRRRKHIADASDSEDAESCDENELQADFCQKLMRFPF